MLLVVLARLRFSDKAPARSSTRSAWRPGVNLLHDRAKDSADALAAPSPVGASGGGRPRGHVSEPASSGARLEGVAGVAQGVPIGPCVYAVARGVPADGMPWLRAASALVGGK